MRWECALQERASQAAQLREYGVALETKLGQLSTDSTDLRAAQRDAAALRSQVGGQWWPALGFWSVG